MLIFKYLSIFFLAAILISAASAPEVMGEAKAEATYDARKTYAGIYQPDGLYMRRSERKAYLAHQKPAILQELTCLDALNGLNVFGRWEGNLRPDGGCGSEAEPAQWVTGNYLNYRLGK